MGDHADMADDMLEGWDDKMSIQEALFGESARTILFGKQAMDPFIKEMREHEKLDRIRRLMDNRRDFNMKAKVGEHIHCTTCNRKMTKRSYQHIFCSNKGKSNCKDRFWNIIDDDRLERAKQFK